VFVTGDHLRDWMFDLQTCVHFQKVKVLILVALQTQKTQAFGEQYRIHSKQRLWTYNKLDSAGGFVLNSVGQRNRLLSS
jgi:hypothetical protein